MKNTSYVIYPNNAFIILLLMGFLGECYLFSRGYAGGTGPRSPGPISMMIIILILFVLSMKCFHFSSNQISIHYLILGIKRIIPWVRVSSVEYVIGIRRCHLFIAIDGCPTFVDSEYRNEDTYGLMHPFKVITLRVSQKNAKKHFLAVKEFYPTVVFVRYNLNQEKWAVIEQIEEL